jgi:hypothetical protein
MKLEVTITKTKFFVLTLLLLVVGVVAYNSNPANPAQFGHSANEIEGSIGVPSGMIAFFNTTCPTGWSTLSDATGRVLRGAPTYGGIGGSADHNHNIVRNCWGAGGGQNTRSCYIDHTDLTSSWPPYLDVIVCVKD